MSREGRNPQIYIGGITRDVSIADIRKEFSEFGKIQSLSVKNKYAFVVSKIFQFKHKPQVHQRECICGINGFIFIY